MSFPHREDERGGNPARDRGVRSNDEGQQAGRIPNKLGLILEGRKMGSYIQILDRSGHRRFL